MSNLNRVMLIGRLGAAPEIRYTQAGQAVCNFRMATSEKWNNKTNGNEEERTEWHKIVIWGKRGEIAAQYLDKGKLVYIEGRLQTRKWTDKNGNDRYSTEIVARDFQFLERKGESLDQSYGQPDPHPGPERQDEGYDKILDETDDDIPF